MKKQIALHFGMPVLAAMIGVWLILSGIPAAPRPVLGIESVRKPLLQPEKSPDAASDNGIFWRKLLARIQTALPPSFHLHRPLRQESRIPQPVTSPTPDLPSSSFSLRASPVKNILKSAEARVILNPGSEDAMEIASRNRGRLRKLTATASTIQQLLGECLTRDLCGQVAPEDTPYFDPNNTEAHRLLNKSLQFLKASADLEPMQVELPPDTELLDRLKIENEETQTLSLSLLLRNGANSSLCSLILGRAGQVKNEAKLNLFTALNHPASGAREESMRGCDRDSIVTALTDSLRKDDPNTVAQVVAGLDRFSLNEQEYISVVTSLCSFRLDPALRGTGWNEIRMHLTKIHEKNTFNVDPDSICAPSPASPQNT